MNPQTCDVCNQETTKYEEFMVCNECGDIVSTLETQLKEMREALEYLTTGELDRPGEVADFARAKLRALSSCGGNKKNGGNEP